MATTEEKPARAVLTEKEALAFLISSAPGYQVRAIGGPELEWTVSVFRENGNSDSSYFVQFEDVDGVDARQDMEFKDPESAVDYFVALRKEKQIGDDYPQSVEP